MNKRNIASLRSQIAKNIKQQKDDINLRNKNSKIELVETFKKRKQEKMQEGIREYIQKAASTHNSFKQRHQKSKDYQKQQNRNQTILRRQYASRIKEVQKKNVLDQKEMKRLDKLEELALHKLNDTMMVHNYVQSRYENVIWPGTSISANIG